jgi:hypothetical protein
MAQWRGGSQREISGNGIRRWHQSGIISVESWRSA